MDFDANVGQALLANRLKRDAEKAAAATVPSSPAAPGAPAEGQQQQQGSSVTQVPAPASGEPASPAAPEKSQVAVPENASTTPAEGPKSTESAPASKDAPPTIKAEEPVWDDGIVAEDEPTTSTTSEPASGLDIKKISSALNLEVKDETEFVEKVGKQLKRLQELEGTDIPEQLKQAIDVARKGGDWLAYTGASAFDASTLDPVQLFKRQYELENAQFFKREDGTIDLERLDQELDAIPDGVKRMQGNLIKNTLVQRQREQQEAILARAAEAQERFDNGLSEAARDLSKLLPKEQFGVLMEPKHSSYFYKGIRNGELIRKHLGHLDPSVLTKLDPKKVIKTLAIAELGEKISEYRYKQGEVAGTKKAIMGVQNAVIDSPSYVPTPEPVTPEQPVTSADRLRQMNERAKPKNSL